MDQQAPLPALTSAPPKPFASIMRRASAFLIDGVLLYLVANMLGKVARDALLAFNPWLPWLGNLAALAYFTAAQGPIGKGRTLGKSILSIVVTNGEGQPLDWTASLRRTVPQQVAFLVVANPGLYSLVFPEPMRMNAGFALTLVMVVALMFVITLVFSISLHPHKRGWHDVWGGSYVTNDPPSQVFRDALEAPLDPIGERKLSHYWKITLALFLITSVTMLYRPITSMRSDEAQRIKRELAELQADHPLGPYFLAAVQHPNPQAKAAFLNQVRAQRQAAITAGGEAPTTDSLRADMINDGEATIAQCLRVSGAFRMEDLDDPDLQTSLEIMRGRLWEEWPQWREERQRELAGRLASAGDEKERQRLLELDDMLSQIEYRTFMVLLFEPLQILIHNDTEPRGIIRGPADPAKGPLVYEEFSAATARRQDPAPEAGTNQ